MTASEQPDVEVRSLEALRDWLSEHHEDTGSVWLVTYKKGHEACLPWGAVVEELMCWGWVDSSVRGIDEVRMKHLISQRKDTSAWSAVNKDIVERMRAAGRMQPSGEAKIAAAKANGMWSFLDDVERLDVPADLAEALGAAHATWDEWTRSVRRAWLEKIKRAKTAPTREKHIAACSSAAREGRKDGGLR